MRLIIVIILVLGSSCSQFSDNDHNSSIEIEDLGAVKLSVGRDTIQSDLHDSLYACCDNKYIVSLGNDRFLILTTELENENNWDHELFIGDIFELKIEDRSKSIIDVTTAHCSDVKITVLGAKNVVTSYNPISNSIIITRMGQAIKLQIQKAKFISEFNDTINIIDDLNFRITK